MATLVVPLAVNLVSTVLKLLCDSAYLELIGFVILTH
jgi:hypothetical protein